MNKFKNILITFFLVFSSANALELGQLKVTSYLNEPLKASFTLDHIASENLGDIILSLANQKNYQAMGLVKPYYLNNLKFNITAGLDNQHIVHISTSKRIMEPILELLVKVTEKQSSLTRQYTLMLDPREYTAVEPVLVSSTSLKPVSVNVAKTQEKKINVNVNVNENENRKQKVGSASNKIKVGNDSISIIAQNSPLHEKYSVYQIMRAFYLLNSAEFYLGNINNLKSASMLIIPDESLVSEVSRQKSINFVYAVSKNNPTGTLQYVKQMEPVKVTLKQLPKENPQEIHKEIQPVKAKPTVLPRSVDNPQQQLNERMVSDVKAWRSVSTEFKILSSVVQNQNDAMKIQSTVLQQIALQLEQKNQQIEMINRRLDTLESSGLTKPGPAGNEVTVDSSLSSTQNNLVIQQGKVINDSLTRSVEEIGIIKHRLDALEAPVKASIVDSLATPEVAALEMPVIQTIVNPQAQSDRLNAFMLWTGLILAAIVIILLGREIVWRRRIKLLASSKEDVQTDVTQDLEISINDDTDFQQSTGLQNLTQTDDQLEAEPVIKNDKLAELIAEDSVSHVNELTVEPSQKQSAEVSVQAKAEILYAEIDVLIAYQLYDEAFELLKNARETLDGNGCLDIRELELLAYTKNVDVFFPRFEKLKETLSKEFPEEWKKVIGLNEKLVVEFLDDSNIVSFK